MMKQHARKVVGKNTILNSNMGKAKKGKVHDIKL